jgi:hypothetical protein
VSGRVPSGRALTVPVEPASSLAPSGFDPSRIRVLVACEYSATVRDAFRARGFDAWSCDLLPTEGDPRWHIQMNVLECLDPSIYRDHIILRAVQRVRGI